MPSGKDRNSFCFSVNKRYIDQLGTRKWKYDGVKCQTNNNAHGNFTIVFTLIICSSQSEKCLQHLPIPQGWGGQTASETKPVMTLRPGLGYIQQWTGLLLAQVMVSHLIWTNDGVMSIRPTGANFCENLQFHSIKCCLWNGGQLAMSSKPQCIKSSPHNIVENIIYVKRYCFFIWLHVNCHPVLITDSQHTNHEGITMTLPGVAGWATPPTHYLELPDVRCTNEEWLTLYEKTHPTISSSGHFHRNFLWWKKQGKSEGFDNCDRPSYLTQN